MLPRGEENRWHREGVYRQTDTHAKPRDRDGVTIIQCKYKTFLYNWLTLWYTWNSHSTVNQLSFNNKTCFKNLRHRKLFLSLTWDHWFDHQSFHLGKLSIKSWHSTSHEATKRRAEDVWTHPDAQSPQAMLGGGTGFSSDCLLSYGCWTEKEMDSSLQSQLKTAWEDEDSRTPQAMQHW